MSDNHEYIVKAYRADDAKAQSYHFHNGHELIFIAEGRAEFIIDEQPAIYESNTLIFISQIEKHKMCPLTRQYIRYVVIIDPDFFDRFVGDQTLCSIFKQRPASFQNGLVINESDGAYIKDLLSRCADEYAENNRFASLSIMTYLLHLLIYVYRGYEFHFPLTASDHTISNAVRIQKYIDKHFLDDLSLDQLSNFFHLNRFYIMELYKNVTGYSVKQYILLRRLSYAKNLLYYTDKSITDIALNSGFNSASNFIRAFKKHENATPNTFRKHLLSKIIP